MTAAGPEGRGAPPAPAPPIDTARLVRWYDLQAPLYRLWRNRLDSPLVEAVVARCVSPAPPGRILDAGCGTGLFSLALARRLAASRVVGLDLSSGMLALAAGEASRRELANLRFARGDVTRLPFASRSFERVVAAGLFPNVNDHRAALLELARVTRDDGRLLVVEFDRAAIRGALRLFFGAMILGYRTVSFFLRRYRFAERWSIRASTIDGEAFQRCAAGVGLRVAARASQHGHLVLELVKGSRR